MDDKQNHIEVSEAHLAESMAEIDDDDDHDDVVRRERGSGMPPPIPTLAEALLAVPRREARRIAGNRRSA